VSPKCENGYKNNKFQWVEILIKCIKHMEAKNSHNEVYIEFEIVDVTVDEKDYVKTLDATRSK